MLEEDDDDGPREDRHDCTSYLFGTGRPMLTIWLRTRIGTGQVIRRADGDYQWNTELDNEKLGKKRRLQ